MDTVSADDMSMGGSSQPMGMPNGGMGVDSPVDTPMGAPMGNGMEDTNVGMDMSGQSMGTDPNMSDQQTNYDNDFDAGVEANEEEDPEKYIQQLTGKLSQSYNKYNESQPKPNVDLAKYVAGMILKQTTKGLEPEDKKEIMDKVADGDDVNTQEDTNGDQQQSQGDMPVDDQSMDAIQQSQQQQSFGESKKHSRLVKINEILNDILNGRDEEEEDIMQKVDNISYKKKPFTSPNFK